MTRSLWLVPLVTACAPVEPAPAPVPRPVQDAAPVVEAQRTDLPPAGYGSLRQNEFSIEIVDMAVHVKVTPLSERVIRLAAPDTYERLRVLAASRSAQAERITEGSGAELFLVSFFSREPNVGYRPEELQLTHRGRSLRPAGIIPLTAGWGRQLLQPEQTQSAIYVFEPPFDYDLALTIRYSLQENDDWHRVILPLLEEERT
ncbi:MAG: hypothetical protein ACLFRX_00970, partial [Gemmatimonadota bacterium]